MSKRVIFLLGKDFHEVDENARTIMLHGEKETELRHCKTDKHLYCSALGAFYMRYGNELHPIKAHLHGPNWRRSGGWGNYLFVRQVCKWAHRLMAVWLPEPKEGETEIDHINGVPTDNRACNLQWVSPAENRKRRVILHARRMIARQDNDPSKLPERMTSTELLVLFSKYNVAGDCYEGE